MHQFQQKPTKHMYNKENLARLKKMDGLAPELMKAFWAFDRAAVAAGAIPVKYKELIADAELTEAAMVAASLRAGAAVTHATHALPS
jgi:hypothetical protein